MDPTNRVAAVLGDALRRRRHRGRWRQLDVGERARVSQAMISRMELGGGGPIALDTWAKVAAAAGLRFSAELLPEAPADEPAAAARRCHALIAETARGGGWTAVTEITSESVQTILVRPERDEVAIVRVWDRIASVDAAVQELDAAIVRESESRGSNVRVGALVVVLRTAGNRRRITESRATFQAAVPAPGADWSRALHHSRIAMPRDPGLIWEHPDGAGIQPTPRRPGWQ